MAESNGVRIRPYTEAIVSYAYLRYDNRKTSRDAPEGEPAVTSAKIFERNTRLAYDITKSIGAPHTKIVVTPFADGISINGFLLSGAEGESVNQSNALSASLSIFILSRIQAELMIGLGLPLYGGMSAGKDYGDRTVLSREEMSLVIPFNHAIYISDRNILPVIAVDKRTSECFMSFCSESGLTEKYPELGSIFFDLSKPDNLCGLDYMLAQTVLGEILSEHFRLGPQFPSPLGYAEHRDAVIRAIKENKASSSPDEALGSALYWIGVRHNKSVEQHFNADEAGEYLIRYDDF